MALIHKKCGTELIPSGIGDFGICPKCKIAVYHLIWNGDMKNGAPYPEFSDDIVMN